VKLRYQSSSSVWLNCNQLPVLVQGCELPVIVCGKQKLVISGLCSVLRYIVQTAQQNMIRSVDCDFADCVKNLLGLRKNCLRACAEVSEWTLYTEVTLPQLVERILNNCVVTSSDLPVELVQLENQLRKLPAEPSQRRKDKRNAPRQHFDTVNVASHEVENSVKQGCRSGDRTDEIDSLSSSSLASEESKDILKRFDFKIVDSTEEICGRSFVEGNSVQLTDLVLFVCIQLLFSLKNAQKWCYHLPKIVSWYQRMTTVPNISDALKSAGFIEYYSVANNIAVGSEISNVSPVQSTTTRSNTSTTLEEYKSDISCIGTAEGCSSAVDLMHSKTATENQNCIQHTEKTRFRVSQELIDAGITKATRMGLLMEVSPLGDCRCLQLPWEQYPEWVLPCGSGGVPESRAARKLHQLENVAAAVTELLSTTASAESKVIVDFCSGGGHVGILLAYLYPQCNVCN